MANCKTTKMQGIRYREHKTRKHGRQKDKYYYIRYMKNQKRFEEGLGWASEGWSEQHANEILCTIKKNIKTGERPQSFKEMREMNERAKEQEEIIIQEKLADRVTVDEIFDKYIKTLKIETSDKNCSTLSGFYKKWIQKSLGSKKLKDITIEQIQNIISTASKTLAPKTVLHIRNLHRQIFNFAKKHELYFGDNPASKVKVKLEDNKRTRFLTREEAALLLEELKKRSIDVHDEALLSIYSGMQAGEIFNLQWEKILWNIDRIHVTKTKNGEDRMEPMHPLVKEMLKRRYKDSQTGYVFKSLNGGKIKEISDSFERAVKKLGFNNGINDRKQKVVFHTLRHTYASWLVMNGVDLYTTQKLMGHKSNQMTQRYAHLTPGYLEKAVNSLESI